MRGCAVLEGENQFVPGAVEGAHTPIVLRPNNEILELGIVRRARFQHLAHVSPIHADKMNRSIDGVGDEIGECSGQEGDEFAARHVARGHCELIMFDFAEAAHIAGDRDIVRRVGKDHFRLFAFHER